MSVDRSTGAPDQERGAAALLVVLWTGVLVASLAVGFALFARVEIRATASSLQQAQAASLATGGLERALADLALPIERAQISRAGVPYSFRLGNSAVSIAIEDETGKINLNAAPEQVIDRLFRLLYPDDATGPVLAARVLDWRDADLTRRPDGAEEPDYRASGAISIPRNGPFQSVNDLHDVLGLAPDQVARIRPFVTVFAQGRKVNPATAPGDVLLSFPDVPANQVRSVLDQRRRGAPLAMPYPLSLWTVSREGPGYRIRVIVRLPSGYIYAEETIVWLTEDTPARDDIRVFETYRLDPPT